jgi:hypothetical protein
MDAQVRWDGGRREGRWRWGLALLGGWFCHGYGRSWYLLDVLERESFGNRPRTWLMMIAVFLGIVDEGRCRATVDFSSSLQLFICSPVCNLCPLFIWQAESSLRSTGIKVARPPRHQPLQLLFPTYHQPATYHNLPTHPPTIIPSSTQQPTSSSCRTSHVSTGPNSKEPATCSRGTRPKPTWKGSKRSAAS